jgi:uncharacterized membrane protein YoaK (UPF0700 family)
MASSLIEVFFFIIEICFLVPLELTKSGNPTTRFLGYLLLLLEFIAGIVCVIFLLSFIEELS